jgi:hypothetical protein
LPSENHGIMEWWPPDRREKWNNEYSESKAYDGLILFSEPCHPSKNRFHSSHSRATSLLDQLEDLVWSLLTLRKVGLRRPTFADNQRATQSRVGTASAKSRIVFSVWFIRPAYTLSNFLFKIKAALINTIKSINMDKRPAISPTMKNASLLNSPIFSP